ncbi:MAG: hypothetical protein ACON4V_07860 [Parvibaculales bacterium]
MFIGHFAAGAALKGADSRVPLWALLAGVQFVDIFAMIFVLLGIERMDVVPGFTATNDLDMFMPYTHSLVLTPVWAVFGAALYKLYDKNADRKALLVVAAAVACHWPLDLLVHVPDMPIFFSEDFTVGFGLWNMPLLTIAIETGILVAAFIIYRKTAMQQVSNLPLFIVLFALMAFFAVHALFMHIPMEDTVSAATTALFFFIGFPVLAYFVERRNA